MCKYSAEYSIFLNSVNAMTGANITDKTYGFDWSTLENGTYDLTFTFRSAVSTGPHEIAFISLPDIGTIQGGQASALTNATSSNVIGILKNEYKGLTAGATGNRKETIYVSNTDNPSIRIQKPTNNTFRVVLNRIDGGAVQGTIPASYVMIIHLKKVDM